VDDGGDGTAGAVRELPGRATPAPRGGSGLHCLRQRRPPQRPRRRPPSAEQRHRGGAGCAFGLVEAFSADERLVSHRACLDPDRTPVERGRRPTLPWLFLLASGLPAALYGVPGYRRVRPLRDRRGRLDWVAGAAMAIRRRTWEEVGFFDTRFRFFAQDLDFCLRAQDAGWRVGLVGDAQVVHVGGATIGRHRARRGAVRTGPAVTDLLLWAEKRRRSGPSRPRAASPSGDTCGSPGPPSVRCFPRGDVWVGSGLRGVPPGPRRGAAGVPCAALSGDRRPAREGRGAAAPVGGSRPDTMPGRAAGAGPAAVAWSPAGSRNPTAPGRA
jgi:hypothetical protein